jgi:hypothetical protein
VRRPVFIGILARLKGDREFWTRTVWRRERNWNPTFSRSIAKRFALVRYGAGLLQPIRLESFGLLSWVCHVGARRGNCQAAPGQQVLAREQSVGHMIPRSGSRSSTSRKLGLNRT